MCQVAQAATAESRVELKGELSVFSRELENQVANLNDEVGRLLTASSNSVVKITELEKRMSDAEATAKTLSTNLINLEIRMSSAETAIVALQASLASLKSVIPGLLESVVIDSENLAAGPVYETILRRADRERIIGFREQLSAPLNLEASNPMEVALGSNIATFKQGGDGLTVGDVVAFSSCAGGYGLTARDVNGELLVVSVGPKNAELTPFSVQVRRERTEKNGKGDLGGTLCVASKIEARGMALLWEFSNGADTSVRVAKTGSKNYHYIVKQVSTILNPSLGINVNENVSNSWSVCYHRTNPLAPFAILDAGGNSVICK